MTTFMFPISRLEGSTVGTDADFDLLSVDEAPGPADDVGTAGFVVGTPGIIVGTP